MTEHAEKQLKPVQPSWLIACAIEAGIVATFITYRSLIGCLLCLAYAWFSAIWALAFRNNK
jgi:hypothetical protein